MPRGSIRSNQVSTHLQQKLRQLGISNDNVQASGQKRLQFKVFFPRPPYGSVQYKALKSKDGFNFVGLVLGHGGATLQRIQRESGTKIEVNDENGNLCGAHPDCSNPALHALVTGDTQAKLERGCQLLVEVLKPVNADYESFLVKPGGHVVLRPAVAITPTSSSPRNCSPLSSPTSTSKSRNSSNGSSRSSLPGDSCGDMSAPSPAPPVTPAGVWGTGAMARDLFKDVPSVHTSAAASCLLQGINGESGRPQSLHEMEKHLHSLASQCTQECSENKEANTPQYPTPPWQEAVVEAPPTPSYEHAYHDVFSYPQHQLLSPPHCAPSDASPSLADQSWRAPQWPTSSSSPTAAPLWQPRDQGALHHSEYSSPGLLAHLANQPDVRPLSFANHLCLGSSMATHPGCSQHQGPPSESHALWGSGYQGVGRPQPAVTGLSWPTAGSELSPSPPATLSWGSHNCSLDGRPDLVGSNPLSPTISSSLNCFSGLPSVATSGSCHDADSHRHAVLAAQWQMVQTAFNSQPMRSTVQQSRYVPTAAQEVPREEEEELNITELIDLLKVPL